MRKIEKITLVVGCTSVLSNIVGLSFKIKFFNYLALLLGRMAALTFIIAVDKIQWYYFLPITLTLINTFVNAEELLFLEYGIQSVIYQISSYKVFTNGQKILRKKHPVNSNV